MRGKADEVPGSTRLYQPIAMTSSMQAWVMVLALYFYKLEPVCRASSPCRTMSSVPKVQAQLGRRLAHPSPRKTPRLLSDDQEWHDRLVLAGQVQLPEQATHADEAGNAKDGDGGRRFLFDVGLALCDVIQDGEGLGGIASMR